MKACTKPLLWDANYDRNHTSALRPCRFKLCDIFYDIVFIYPWHFLPFKSFWPNDLKIGHLYRASFHSSHIFLPANFAHCLG